MRHRNRVAALAVLAVGLLAASPLLKPQLIHASDSLSHYYTLVQLDHLVRQGILYTRWFPYKASGFGAPFFQFYAPLAFFAAEGLVWLGLETLLAFRMIWALTLVGSAVGVFLWTRDILDDGAALVAATAYVCGPYMLYNAFFRGGYTEQFALMLLPFVLWGFRRLAVTARGSYLAASALLYAGLHLAHTLTALIFTPALLAYTIVLATEHSPPPGTLRTRSMWLFMLWVPVALGLGLSAFFWLPAFAERDALQTALISANPALDYRHNFIPLRRLISMPVRAAARPALSSVTVVLAALGLLGQWRRRSGVSVSWNVWLAALIAGGCILMALPVATPLWNAAPLLALFQFPHRFLSVALPFLAFLAGVGVQSLGLLLDVRKTTVRRWWFVGIMLLVLGLLVSQARVLRRVLYYPPLPEIDVQFIMQKEREAAPIVGQYASVYMPAWVEEMPPLEEQAQDGPERLDLDSLPAGTSVLDADYTPLRYDLTFSSPEEFSARFRTFYFPGWAAELDGQPVSIDVTEPHGQIRVLVPAGEHRLEVWFGTTAIRAAAVLVSLVSAVAVCLAFCAMMSYNHPSMKVDEP